MLLSEHWAVLNFSCGADVRFLASCGQVTSNALLRGLPLQSVFQHHSLNFWLPNFTKHVFHVERVPVMDLGGFVSADLFIFFPLELITGKYKISTLYFPVL